MAESGEEGAPCRHEPLTERKGMSGIHSLNIHNFKSWGGTHVIGPFHTFSCIVGSNGSGKSNLMDAISFVLGVRTQQLRGQHIRDLIYRPANPDASPLQKAYVELVYEHGDDNTTVFKKSVSRSQGKAQYWLDGKPVSWKAYEERLRDFGVIVRARNFLVFQGDVESIAQKSPKQLTELFEEVSGSSSLYEEYEACLEQSKDAESVFLRSFEKKKSLLKEKRQIKEQKEEAERYQRMQGEYRYEQQQFFLWQLFHLNEELRSTKEAIHEQNDLVNNINRHCKSTDSELKESSKLVAKLRRQRGALDKALSKQTRRIDDERMSMIKLEEEFNHLQTSLASAEDKFEKAKTVSSEHSELVNSLKEELKTVKALMSDLEAGINAEEASELQIEESQLQEYNKCKQKAGEKTVALRQELEKLESQLKSGQIALAEHQSQADSLSAHKKQLLDSKHKAQERIRCMQSNVDDFESKRATLQHDLSSIEDEQRQSRESRQAIQKQLAEVERELLSNRVQRVESDREQRLSEAIVAMQRLYPGVKGRISALCRPSQRRYNSAVAIALGKNLNAVVVDSRRTALECIRYLKEQRVGVATFLPLDSLNLPATSELPDAYRRFGDKVKLVRDVIDVDESLMQAVLFACGNTLVADTLQDARRVAFGSGANTPRVKVVTLDGDLLHKSGNMSGGAQREQKDSNDTWDRHKLALVKQKRDELLKELAELPEHHQLRSREQSLLSQLAGAQSRLRYSQQDLKITTEKLSEIEEALQEVERDLKACRPNLQKQEANLALIESRSDAVQRKIARQEDAIFSAFSASIGVSSIREYEENRLQTAKQRSERRVDLSNHISRLENQIEYQSKKSAQFKLDTLDKRIVEDRSSMQVLKTKLRNAERSIRAHKDECEKMKKESVGMKRDAEEASSEIKRLKDELGKGQDDLSSTRSKVAALEADADKLLQRQRDLLQTCRLEQVEIPTIRNRSRNKRGRRDESEDESESEEDEEDEDAMDVDETAAEAESSQGPAIDFSELRHSTDIEDEEQFRAQKEALQDELAKLAAELEGQAPNLKAVQRFAEVSERVKSTLEDFDEMRGTAKDASGKFAQIRRKRLDIFMKAFNHVSETIDTVYKELTQSQDFPLGGTAFLSLENPENPFMGGIKYSAMPPMKRFRDMEQLSGGEKTVAALALLFAIHSFHPSPFFVLDEIDAALDKANVTKVARYVRSRARNDGLQCVVISLKDTFFDKADALVGVYKDRQSDCSGSVTIDLTKYD